MRLQWQEPGTRSRKSSRADLAVGPTGKKAGALPLSYVSAKSRQESNLGHPRSVEHPVVNRNLVINQCPASDLRRMQPYHAAADCASVVEGGLELVAFDEAVPLTITRAR